MSGICFLIRSLDAGGAERQLVALARDLHGRGMDVTVCVFYGGGVFERDLRESGIRIVNLQKRGRWSILETSKRLLRSIPPDCRIVHGYMGGANHLLLAMRPWLRRRGLLVVCGVRATNMDLREYDVVSRFAQWIHDRMLRWADGVICNSRVAARELASQVPAARLAVVPNGIDCSRFRYDDTLRAAGRSDLGLTDGEIAIGQVGRIDPQKNHRLLVESLSRLLPSFPNLKLVLVGEGTAEHREAVEQWIDAVGMRANVVWSPATEDMAKIYSSLDVLCQPSLSEAFPNVVAEAMACGLPVVATDVGDTSLIVDACGWVVAPGDAQAFRDGLERAIAALPTWDIERPRQRIVEEFGVQSLGTNTLATLSRWLGAAP